MCIFQTSYYTMYYTGNEQIHQLTLQPKALRLDMGYGWECRFAEYTTFSVASETENYRVHVAGYSGDAGKVLMIIKYY